jgi:hypothetical protein
MTGVAEMSAPLVPPDDSLACWFTNRASTIPIVRQHGVPSAFESRWASHNGAIR